jgi:hypothetical protein
MYSLNLYINGEFADTVKSTTVPFVPRTSDKIRVNGVLYRVLEVVVEYIVYGTEFFVYLEKI